MRRNMDDGRLEIASAGIEYGPLGSVFRVDLAAPAGDIDRDIEGILWEREAFLSIPMLYVADNNEHYDERIARLHQRPREAAAGSNALPNQRNCHDGLRSEAARNADSRTTAIEP